MKKVLFEWMLYYLQIVFVGIFVLVLCACNIEVKQKDFLARGMYTENVRGIQLSSDYLASVYGEVVDLEIPQIKYGDFMLYKFLSEEYNEIVRGIYGTKDIFHYSNYIESGRFFEEEDYRNKTAVAVIGASMTDRVYTENGKEYFGYDNRMFEVIGVLKETDSALDDTVYLNLSCLLEEMDHYGLYYVDAQSSDIVEEVIRRMKDNAREKYTTSEVEYEAEKIYGLGAMSNTLLYCAVLAAFLNLLISSMFFVADKRYSVAIQKLCGMTKKDLLLQYGKRIFVLVFACFTTICFIIYFFADHMGFFFELDTLAGPHYGIMAVLLIIVGAVVAGCIVRQADRVEISSTLKGR